MVFLFLSMTLGQPPVVPNGPPLALYPNPFVVDDDRPERWPNGLKFPSEMKPYKRSEFTQNIFTTNGFTVHHIEPVRRSNLERKWQVSGGMADVKEFRSDLYRYFPEYPSTWVDNIPVWNGSNFQNNRGWKIEWPDGSKFMDVLSNKGEVFEIRQRKKESGKWNSLVLFEDPKARPIGYTGLSVSCASCHSQAGTGSYGAGLVPGGDGVISVGFKALER